MMVEALIVRNVTCRYITAARRKVEALRGVSFGLRRGEFLTLVGHSGAGKSSLLAIIAGLRPPTSGQVIHSGAGPEHNIGYLFQRDAVFPWRTVEGNLSYAAEIAGESRDVRRQLAEELCSLVGLDPAAHLSKLPSELSGGEVRRLGLGMALSKRPQPQVLLLDEPTSSLDWLSRREVQAVIQQLVWNKGITVVTVTHDVEEALWMSDRIIVLREGKIAATIDVDLPRPRTHEMRTSTRFQALEDEVVGAMTHANGAQEVPRC